MKISKNAQIIDVPTMYETSAVLKGSELSTYQLPYHTHQDKHPV